MINYDTLADSYDSHYQSDMCKKENIAVHNLLIKYKVTELKTLDVGCGTGFALDLCNIRDYKGIDISKEMIKQAIKKYPKKNFVATDIQSANLGLTTYDCTLCLFSIPYIGLSAVDKIFSHLNTGGICICVYYDKPYLNSDSVYFERKEEFVKDVLPKVKRVVTAFESKFTTIEEHYLTLDGTYTVAVFRKD